MAAKAKKISLYLENGSLDGLINLSETDGWDYGGELFACPREKLDALLCDDSTNKYGVYLLLSSSKVYVGQSTDLKERIKRHQLEKDWWERVILLTSKNDELNQSHITYLESRLINKAHECGTLDCENKTKGNENNLSKFDKKLLDQYLDESFFVLELIGVKVFSKNGKTVETIINAPVDKDEKHRELRAKKETMSFLNNHGISLYKNVSYAKLQDKGVFWINPNTGFLLEDWTIILNNQKEQKLIVLNVPARSFQSCFPLEKGKLVTRKDKPYYIDLNLNKDSLVDTRTGCDFSKYANTIFY